MSAPAAPMLGLLAHPLLDPEAFPVPPVTAALLVTALIAALAYRRVGAVAPPAGGPGGPWSSWEGGLSRGQIAGRAVAIAVLLVSVVAGRRGPNSEVANLAPALLLGVGWPVLVLASAVAGRVWRWVDPWDGVARALERPGEPDATTAAGVHAAAFVALAWAGYLIALPDALGPRTVALAAGGYALAMVLGSVAFGRRRWLPRVDAAGLLLSWVARIPRGRLLEWDPPPGAAMVLGASLGGLLFGLIRASSLWEERTAAAVAAGVLVGAVSGAAGLVAADRVSARAGRPGAVVAASVPAFAAILGALALARSRLFTSLRVAAAAASDPFGLGWDLFGTADWAVGAVPGPVPVAWMQLGLLLAGHGIAAWIVARRGTGGRARDAAVAVVAVSAAISVAAVTAV